MHIVNKMENGKNKVDKIIYQNGFQILPNIDNEKYFAAKLGTLLCVDFNSYNTENDELKYKFSLQDENYYERLSDDQLYDDYLLFENLGNGQIKEVISGVVFNVCFLKEPKEQVKGNEIFESSRSIEEVQNNGDFEKVLENPLGIWINASIYDLDEMVDNYLKSDFDGKIDSELVEEFEDEHDFAYKVDDNFKYYYSEKILPKSDLIIETLRNAETIARKIVKEKIENEKNRLHGIALTENAIYDYEHVEHSSRKR